MSKEPDRRKLSFAAAEGQNQYPDILKWGEVDQRLRAALWNTFWVYFDAWVTDATALENSTYKHPLVSILLRDFLNRRHGFVTDFVGSFSKRTCIESWAEYFRTKNYIELFDFITFFLRDEDCPKDLISEVADVLDEPWSPYRLIKKPPTIIPAVSSEEAKTLKGDLESVFSSRFQGARTHLRASLDALNKNDHRGVVRESIHAVESAVKDFTGDPKATLSRALKKLTDERALHPSLAGAFDKLYAYSSDEKGIRHALVFGENEKVGFDEAIFFVSACSAFIGLLSRKD